MYTTFTCAQCIYQFVKRMYFGKTAPKRYHFTDSSGYQTINKQFSLFFCTDLQKNLEILCLSALPLSLCDKQSGGQWPQNLQEQSYVHVLTKDLFI